MLDEVFDPFSLYNYCSPRWKRNEGEHFFAGVAQLVEQLIRNQQVSGSSPLAGSLPQIQLRPASQRAFSFFSGRDLEPMSFATETIGGTARERPSREP